MCFLKKIKDQNEINLSPCDIQTHCQVRTILYYEKAIDAVRNPYKREIRRYGN